MRQFSREKLRGEKVTVVNHLDVISLGRAGAGVPPVEIHALAPVEVAELLGVDLDQLWIVQLEELLEGEEVHKVGTINGRRDPVDEVGN